MDDDLISRNDAIKKLREYADEVGCNRGEYELANGILKAVSFLKNPSPIPTAYDVNKVVERLDKASDYYECEEQGREHVQMVDLVDAIEIVRTGGNNE